jgi:hypothetical protein
MKITGKDGQVSVGGNTIESKSWSLDVSIDEYDASAFGNSGNKSYVFGLKEATGTFEGNITSTASATIGAVTLGDNVPFILTIDSNTGNTITFNGVITGISPSVAVEDEATYTMNFRVDEDGITWPTA